jgi:integrase
MRILNLAVDFEELDKNRLAKITTPKSGKRHRIPTTQELAAIAKQCRRELKAAALIALHTGLREEMIWSIQGTWIEQREDGPWLALPKPRTQMKQNPDAIPLNKFAYEALTRAGRSQQAGRIFSLWSHPHAISTAWRRARKRANIDDLHFHDMRHWFSTSLENLGVHLRIIQLLDGHVTSETTAIYLHGGTERDAILRDAVERLSRHWQQHYMKAVWAVA